MNPTLLFFFHTRSSGSPWAAERIGEHSRRGGAYSHELGEYFHGNQKRLREKKKNGHNPPSLSPVPVFTPLCSSLNQSQSSVCSYLTWFDSFAPLPPCSSLAWRPMLHTAVTRWGPKPCWTRRSMRKEWSTSCACVRSLRSAGNWTCGTSWISLGAVWSNTPCCWKRYRSAHLQTTRMRTHCLTLWVDVRHVMCVT